MGHPVVCSGVAEACGRPAGTHPMKALEDALAAVPDDDCRSRATCRAVLATEEGPGREEGPGGTGGDATGADTRRTPEASPR